VYLRTGVAGGRKRNNFTRFLPFAFNVKFPDDHRILQFWPKDGLNSCRGIPKISGRKSKVCNEFFFNYMHSCTGAHRHVSLRVNGE